MRQCIRGIILLLCLVTSIAHAQVARDQQSYMTPDSLVLSNPIGKVISATTDMGRLIIKNNRLHIQPVRSNKFSAPQEYPAVNINALEPNASLLGFSFTSPEIGTGQEIQFHFFPDFDGSGKTLDANGLNIRGTGGDLIHFDPELNGSIINQVGINDTSPDHALDINGILQVDYMMHAMYQTVDGSAFYFQPSANAAAPTLGMQIHIVNSTEDALKGGAHFNITSGTDDNKTFIIDHPTQPGHYLIHAATEGPENAVFYRGTTRLTNGQAKVELPDYFEALTHVEGRQIFLTPVNSFSRLIFSKVIQDNSFMVFSNTLFDNSEFDWEVKAIRKDIPLLDVEPFKESVTVKGDGPYRYVVPKGGSEQ